MPLQYIDTRVGTENTSTYSNGNCLPYTGSPFGMNYFGVQNGEGSWWFSPSKPLFVGFRLTHQPSPWMGDFSHMLFTPFTGNPHFLGTYHLQSSYRTEEATFKPHLNEVYSLRYSLSNQLTASKYGMTLKSTSDNNEAVGFVLSAHEGVTSSYDEATKILTGSIKNFAGSEDKEFTMHFAITFNEDVTVRQDKFDNDEAICIIQSESESLTLSFASSFISADQAVLNLSRESKDFDEQVEANRQAWLKVLNRIEAKDKNKDHLKMFYSALYRTFLFPMTFYEINENNEEIHYNTTDKVVAPGKLFTNNGFWDTYKSLFPLFSLIAQDEYEAMLEGFLNSYNETGYLPKWLSPDERGLMPGTLIDAVISDALVKDISLDNAEALYAAMVQSATTESADPNYGRRAVNDYWNFGYVPSDYDESVNQSLDNAYSDYCIAQVAEKLGKTDDHKRFMESSYNYEKLFDKESKFMRAKDRNGNFSATFDPNEWGHAYTEGSAWQNSWAVYHDFKGLINLFDSKDSFLSHITDLANQKPKFSVGSYGFEIHEMSEVAAIDFGQVAISNQPSFHLPYLYTYAGKPESTQVLLRQLMKETFSATTTGYPGDEDNGSMSAWYVFNACGFYPVCPGSAEYVLGIPLLDEVKIHLSNGNTINLKTDQNHTQHNFVDKRVVNNEEYSKLYLNHHEMMEGMNIHTTLGLVPRHKEYEDEDLPFSLTK